MYYYQFELLAKKLLKILFLHVENIEKRVK